MLVIVPVLPPIRVDLVTDPVFLRSARSGQVRIDERQVTQPSPLFSCPASVLLGPTDSPRDVFVLYQHIFGAGASYLDDGYFYVGVTTRIWQKRWAEHRRAIEAGSPLFFHQTFREESEARQVTYIHHKVMGVTHDLNQLYAAEEFLVEGHWQDARRLNMSPGGKSGLRYLRENGLLPPRTVTLPDERDGLLDAWLREHTRKGLPAPWVSERWRDDDWAVAQICGREDRLSADQVRAIRSLAEAHDPEEIALRIGARTFDQVKWVLDDKTYARVR